MAEGLEAETGPMSMTASPGQGFKAMGAWSMAAHQGCSPPAEPPSSPAPRSCGLLESERAVGSCEGFRNSLEAGMRLEAEKQVVGAGGARHRARSCRALDTIPVNALGDTGQLRAEKTMIL